MDQSAYASMSAVEDHHWWFVARRRILASLIERFIRPRQGARLLEAGCGTGGNLAMLSRYGALEAFEFDAGARGKAQAKAIAPVCFGALPRQLNQQPQTYDLVALLDVLEHVEDDAASLASLGGLLKSGGHLLVTVPALPSLWSSHDVLHHHHRRYTRRSLMACARQAGLKIERIGYFNSLLFPLAWAQRMAHKLLKREMRPDAVPGAGLNRLFQGIFASERHLLGRVPMPIGLSLYAILSRD